MEPVAPVSQVPQSGSRSASLTRLRRIGALGCARFHSPLEGTGSLEPPQLNFIGGGFGLPVVRENIHA